MLLPADAWPTRRAGGSDGGGGPTRPHRAVIDRSSCDRLPRGASEGSLARCDGLLLSSHARLLVVLPLAQLFQETRFLALFLEATDGAVDRLVILDANPGHTQYSPALRDPERPTGGTLAHRCLAAGA